MNTNTTSITGSTIAQKADSALSKIIVFSEFLADEKHVLWLRMTDGKGVGIQRFGAAVVATPGYFDGDLFLVYGLKGSEAFQVTREDAPQIMARVIRRASKLEAAAR